MKEVVLTKKLLKKGMTGKLGCSKAQLVLLGVSCPPRKGWEEDLEGRVISQETYQLFLKLRKHGKKPKRSRVVWKSGIIHIRN